VYTLAHLAQLAGVSWRFLRDVVARNRDPYIEITRPKRDGTMRPIVSPEPVLMDTQRWLLHHVVCACDSHPASYAYQRQRSIVACAQLHVGARWLIKLDVHNFFGSVSERRIYRVFQQLGYPSLLCFELARLCTRWEGRGGSMRIPSRHGLEAPYPVEAEGSLPQGAPTSGALANAAMRPVDTELAAYAASSKLVYTRYSDDLTFSAVADFSRQDAIKVISQTAAALRCQGFDLHQAKTRIVPPGARHIVLGLLVDDAGVRLLSEFKRRLELHVRGVTKFGLAAHAGHRHFDSILSMVNHVDGGIAFAQSVEPAFAERLRDTWSEALAASGYPVALG
jgi:RNA-directed DNA polymerase